MVQKLTFVRPLTLSSKFQLCVCVGVNVAKDNGVRWELHRDKCFENYI